MALRRCVSALALCVVLVCAALPRAEGSSAAHLEKTIEAMKRIVELQRNLGAEKDALAQAQAVLAAAKRAELARGNDAELGAAGEAVTSATEAWWGTAASVAELEFEQHKKIATLELAHFKTIDGAAGRSERVVEEEELLRRVAATRGDSVADESVIRSVDDFLARREVLKLRRTARRIRIEAITEVARSSASTASASTAALDALRREERAELHQAVLLLRRAADAAAWSSGGVATYIDSVEQELGDGVLGGGVLRGGVLGRGAPLSLAGGMGSSEGDAGKGGATATATTPTTPMSKGILHGESLAALKAELYRGFPLRFPVEEVSPSRAGLRGGAQEGMSSTPPLLSPVALQSPALVPWWSSAQCTALTAAPPPTIAALRGVHRRDAAWRASWDVAEEDEEDEDEEKGGDEEAAARLLFEPAMLPGASTNNRRQMNELAFVASYLTGRSFLLDRRVNSDFWTYDRADFERAVAVVDVESLELSGAERASQQRRAVPVDGLGGATRGEGMRSQTLSQWARLLGEDKYALASILTTDGTWGSPLWILRLARGLLSDRDPARASPAQGVDTKEDAKAAALEFELLTHVEGVLRHCLHVDEGRVWKRFVKLRALLPTTYYAVNVRHKKVDLVADGAIDAPLLDCVRLTAFGWASLVYYRYILNEFC